MRKNKWKAIGYRKDAARKRQQNQKDMASGLRAAGLAWTEHNHNSHWVVRDPFRLDVWPTTRKTMYGLKVVVWDSDRDFTEWLLASKDGQTPSLPDSAHLVVRGSSLHQRPPEQQTFLDEPLETARTIGKDFDEAAWIRFTQTDSYPFRVPCRDCGSLLTVTDGKSYITLDSYLYRHFCPDIRWMSKQWK